MDNLMEGKGKYALLAIGGAIALCVATLGLCGFGNILTFDREAEPVVIEENEDDDDFTAQDAEDDFSIMDSDFDVGTLVASREVDRDNCPSGATAQFRTSDEINVTAVDSDIPEGTDVFMRLHHDGQPIEDTSVITANQDYVDSCVNFVFEPVTIDGFEPGMYEAEFIVDGNSIDTISFEVQ